MFAAAAPAPAVATPPCRVVSAVDPQLLLVAPTCCTLLLLLLLALTTTWRLLLLLLLLLEIVTLVTVDYTCCSPLYPAEQHQQR